MRVNVYAEEMTDQVEIIHKVIDGHDFTGLRLYLHLPVTDPTRRALCPKCGGRGGVRRALAEEPCGECGGRGTVLVQHQGPFIHRPGDDDSSAVTFWGKRDLRAVLALMVKALDAHYAEHPPE